MTINLFDVYKQVAHPKKLALGYPVNRGHIFPIDLKKLGFVENTLASTFINNVGSPYTPKLYSIDDIRDLEMEVISRVFQYLNGKNGEDFGYITSGETEANLAAIWWHREYLANKFKKMPTLIASNKSHYSLDKIANQLQLKLLKLDSDNLIELLDTKLKSINTPVIFWANIGSTVDGTIDDINQVFNTLNKHKHGKFKIHGDGAIYGLLIPYLDKLKSTSSIFNLVDTLSISRHKFLGTYSVCGIILAYNSYIEQVFNPENIKINYVRGALDYTVSGSRPGIHIAELFLLLEQAFKINESGITNLEAKWKECLDTASWFYEQLRVILGNNSLLRYKPNQLSIIIPAPKNQNESHEIRKKYSLMTVGENQFGIYILPRSTSEKLNLFLLDYKNINDFHHSLN